MLDFGIFHPPVGRVTPCAPFLRIGYLLVGFARIFGRSAAVCESISRSASKDPVGLNLLPLSICEAVPPHRESSIQHPASSIQHRASSIEHRAPVGRVTPCAPFFQREEFRCQSSVSRILRISRFKPFFF